METKFKKDLFKTIEENEITSENFDFEYLKIILNDFSISNEIPLFKWKNKKDVNYYSMGAKVHVNERFLNKIIKNVQKLTFVDYFRIEFINILKNEIQSEKEEIVNESVILSDSYFCIKYFLVFLENVFLLNLEEPSILLERIMNYSIHSFYMLNLDNKDIKNSYSVKLYQNLYKNCEARLNKINDKFKNYIIYIDTDEIYFRWDPKLLKYIEEITKEDNLETSIENIENFILLAKKRYLQYSDDSKIKTKGLQILF